MSPLQQWPIDAPAQRGRQRTDDDHREVCVRSAMHDEISAESRIDCNDSLAKISDAGRAKETQNEEGRIQKGSDGWPIFLRSEFCILNSSLSSGILGRHE